MAINLEYEARGGYPVNPSLLAAGMVNNSIQNAMGIYGQLQQVKMQQEELNARKAEAKYNVGMKLITDPKLPASIKVKAYQGAIKPYLQSMDPNFAIDLSEDDFKSEDVQSLIDEIKPIYESKDYTPEQKKAFMAIPLAKWQSRHSLNKEAGETLQYGFGMDRGNPSDLKHVEYIDEKGNRRHGAFDPRTGTVRDASATAPGPRNTNRINELTLRSKAEQMARDMYVQKYPDKVEIDPITNRITQYKLTIDDRFSDEYLDMMQQAEKLLSSGAGAVMGGQPSQPDQAAGPATNEVERTTKDGRIAIFDANTKKFLRWK